jgi:hypothetical protein
MATATWAVCRVLLIPLRITLRVARICLMAVLIGLGGGMGGLGGGPKKVVKVDPDNQVVCVMEESCEQE